MKLIKGILDLLLAVFTVCFLFLSVPRLWGYRLYAVTSGSMEPALCTGDLIYAKEVQKEELKVGDIITFRTKGAGISVTHRIADIDEEHDLIQTKGDANEQADTGWIAREDVAGKVFYSLRWLGYLAAAMSAWSGKLFLLAVFLWMTAARMMVEDMEELCRKVEIIL